MFEPPAGCPAGLAVEFSPRVVSLVETLGLLGTPSGASWLDLSSSDQLRCDLAEEDEALASFTPFYDFGGELDGWLGHDWDAVYTYDHETAALTLATTGGLDSWLAERLDPYLD